MTEVEARAAGFLRLYIDTDPASKKARGLAKRWLLLWESSTGGDPEIQAGMRKTWKDRKRWPWPMRQYVDESDWPRINSWIGKAIHELRKK